MTGRTGRLVLTGLLTTTLVTSLLQGAGLGTAAAGDNFDPPPNSPPPVTKEPQRR